MPENNTETGDEKLLILPLGEESKKITQVISSDTARQVIELLADAPLSASDIAERLNTPLTTIIYNLENLESVGLVKVEKIKYSEKGRKVKIYAPVRKVIVVVPEKTDRESVLDVLRRYMGVVLAAVLASSVIEFFAKGFGMRSYSMDLVTADKIPSEVPGIEPVGTIMEKGGEVTGNFTGRSGNITPVYESIDYNAAMPAQEAPVEQISPQVAHTPAATPVPAGTVDTTTLAHPEPGILSNIVDTILAHPGLVFLLGCLFVITALIVFDIIRKRKDR